MNAFFGKKPQKPASNGTVPRNNGAATKHSHQNKQHSTRLRLPVLIFPGFMSSALEVKQSPVYNTSTSSSSSSRARRIWLNISSAGFGKLYFGGALKANEEKYELGENYNEELHQEYMDEYQCKSKWLQHLILSEVDLVSDPPDIQIRPTKGIQAVDYLVEHGIAKNASWVFSNVIAALRQVGYVEGYDLDAAPYDWRVPPCVLETRDQYFTKTIQQVERMYQDNDRTPVVLLCHSMGCKACHYFLNFALRSKGQAWLDQHVHTYFVVGAPHVGAPKSVRGTVIGDRMGLEAFLSEEEALILARTWGSLPWMYPRMLPNGLGPIAYLRREGVLHVTVLPFDCGLQVLGSHRRNKPTRLKLAVKYGDEVLHSRFHVPTDEKNSLAGEDQFLVSFSETFTFATPAELETAIRETLRISLYEPGFRVRNSYCRSNLCTWISNRIKSAVDLLCPVEYWRRIGFLNSRPTVSGAVQGAAVAAGQVVTTALGSAALLADSEEKSLLDIELSANDPAECSLQLRFGDIRKLGRDYKAGKPKIDIVMGETSSIPVKVRLEWKPPAHDVDTDAITDIRVGSPSEDAPTLDIRNRHGGEAVQYEAVSGVQLFRSEWISRSRDLMNNYYENDPLGPQTLSSEGAPPVKQVKAVYGIDLPTEVAAVYRRRTIVQEKNKKKCLHEMDIDARLDRRHTNFQMKDGSILETDQSPQLVHEKDEPVLRSGDGTVPYFSLQQCRKWQSEECNVQVHELPHADHREILGDERFLKILVDHVTAEPSNRSSLDSY